MKDIIIIAAILVIIYYLMLRKDEDNCIPCDVIDLNTRRKQLQPPP